MKERKLGYYKCNTCVWESEVQEWWGDRSFCSKCEGEVVFIEIKEQKENIILKEHSPRRLSNIITSVSSSIRKCKEFQTELDNFIFEYMREDNLIILPPFYIFEQELIKDILSKNKKWLDFAISQNWIEIKKDKFFVENTNCFYFNKHYSCTNEKNKTQVCSSKNCPLFITLLKSSPKKGEK